MLIGVWYCNLLSIQYEYSIFLSYRHFHCFPPDHGHHIDRVIRAPLLGEAKVTELDASRRAAVQQCVVQLQVPMSHVLGMTVRHCPDELLRRRLACPSGVRIDEESLRRDIVSP